MIHILWWFLNPFAATILIVIFICRIVLLFEIKEPFNDLCLQLEDIYETNWILS